MTLQQFLKHKGGCVVCKKQLSMIATIEFMFINNISNCIDFGGEVCYKYKKRANKFIKNNFKSIDDISKEAMKKLYEFIPSCLPPSLKMLAEIDNGKINTFVDRDSHLLLPTVNFEKRCSSKDHTYSIIAEPILNTLGLWSILSEQLDILDYEIYNNICDKTTHIVDGKEAVSFTMPIKQMNTWNFNKDFGSQINRYMILA